MSSPLASYERQDSVGIITMDDGKANAISLAMQQSLASALDQAEADDVAVVLTGRAGFFSAGFDLKTIAAGGKDTVDMLNGGINLAIRLLEFPRPVIAASGGHAIAMGVFLLLSCDFRIGVRGPHRYTANEVAIGMTMPYSTIEILRQRVSPAALGRAVSLAEVFGPHNAVENGFLDTVVEPDELIDSALATATTLASLDRAAHVHSKRRLRGPVISAIRDGLTRDDEAWRAQFLR